MLCLAWWNAAILWRCVCSISASPSLYLPLDELNDRLKDFFSFFFYEDKIKRQQTEGNITSFLQEQSQSRFRSKTFCKGRRIHTYSLSGTLNNRNSKNPEQCAKRKNKYKCRLTCIIL
uniref:Putative secreted protein n=1 Tax=Ixodes ricinus TaxID=34613 RepID=A0A6B0UM95_IXORI